MSNLQSNLTSMDEGTQPRWSQTANVPDGRAGQAGVKKVWVSWMIMCWKKEG